MRLDVVQLGRFYASPLGRAARAMIQRRLAALWPDARGLDMLALGYGAAFMEPYRATARRVVAAMPAPQGVEIWPGDGRAAAALVEETSLPFREAVFDRALVVHLIEESEALRPVLRELWRVTAPAARVVVIAASRRGLWSRFETTPFGHGRSFTRGQLTRVLRGGLFEPVHWARALYAPPVPWTPVVQSAEAWERAGERLWPRFGGVILVEAVKREFAGAPQGRRFVVAPPQVAEIPPLGA